jgi:hypothetical protein
MRTLALIALLASSAHADDLADAYVARSLSVFTATELSPLPTVSGRGDLEGGARWQRNHLALEGRAGAIIAFTTTPPGNMYGARFGASAGYSLALARNIAVTPMLAGDVFLLRQSTIEQPPTVWRATVELPVSFILYPHVAVEPYVQVGIAWSQGTSTLALVVGPRIALVL